MAKIVESLKRLSVENGSTRRPEKSSRLAKCKGEYVVSIEESVSSDDQNYILAICGTQSESDFRVAVALADHSCVVYTAGESFGKTATLKHNQSSIIGVKFSHTSRNIIYIASNDGNVTACDLRAKGKVIAEFKDNTEDGKLKPLASFDVSCDERLIAGGTEHIGGDAFILFWDIRYSNSKLNGKNNLLGGYWESHMDDITSLAFHPTKRDALSSGSTDGLINVFDLTQTSEDSALTYSLNTESSVDRIGWLTNDNLWCTTHTHSLQLWNCEDATPYNKFDRSNVALSQNDDPDSCYLVRIHAPSTFGNPYLLAGLSSTKGEFLKCLSFGKNQLEPLYNVSGNKQIVRDSWLHEKSGCLVTGGEAGILNIWRQTEPALIQRNANHKRPAKIGAEKSRSDKNHRTKPY
ncbi:WD repeat-containing protein 89 [Nasonia vitripennis]|uniref:WD repeat-containing protein 89 n=1 Tax=Nasonia vitripennis TaxID=7425 RepID=A0A7M7G7H6_NASVI|nr:WD repeat-containing protein 89 [Nasonia vitripennis]XP_032454099.1 WD repeat-containing protein 89 [Nasonia vitripennis]